MAKKKKPAPAPVPVEADFDNAETLVRDGEGVELDEDMREFLVGKVKPSSPPALPFALKKKSDAESEWIDALPDAARNVLERARTPVSSWPEGPRVPGAVAKPLAPLPRKKR